LSYGKREKRPNHATYGGRKPRKKKGGPLVPGLDIILGREGRKKSAITGQRTRGIPNKDLSLVALRSLYPRRKGRTHDVEGPEQKKCKIQETGRFDAINPGEAV